MGLKSPITNTGIKFRQAGGNGTTTPPPTSTTLSNDQITAKLKDQAAQVAANPPKSQVTPISETPQVDGIYGLYKNTFIPAKYADEYNAMNNVEKMAFEKDILPKKLKDEATYRGREVIDDDKYAQLVALGYDDKTLREKYIPKTDAKLAEKYGEMYWNAPNVKTAEDTSAKDKAAEGARSMILQQVLAPYIRQIGTDFQNQRAGVQATQAELMKQIAPQYQPYLQAMNNATYQAQDQSWIDTLNNMAIGPIMDQQNALISEYIKQLQNQDSTGGDQFLNALMTGQISG